MNHAKITRPRLWQLIALTLGMASMFLEWTDVRYGTHILPARLVDLMVDGPLPCLVLGAVFAVGLVLPLKWRRAALLQLCGLAPLTMLIVTGLDGRVTAVTDVMTSLSALGPGAYLAWTAAMLSLPLRRAPSVVQHSSRGDVFRTSRRGGTVVIRPRRSSARPEQGNPLLAEAMEQGDRELREGDLTSALRSYGRALGHARGAGQRAACKVQVALVLHGMGRMEEAHLFLQEARELDPRAWRGGEGRLLPIKVPTSKRRIRFRLSPEP